MDDDQLIPYSKILAGVAENELALATSRDGNIHATIIVEEFCRAQIDIRLGCSRMMISFARSCTESIVTRTSASIAIYSVSWWGRRNVDEGKRYVGTPEGHNGKQHLSMLSFYTTDQRSVAGDLVRKFQE
ncbi:unnamed protein product, partial [Strongylus vulgaris]